MYKKSRLQELRSQNSQELAGTIAKLKKEIVDAKMELALNKLKNTSAIGRKRKKIAQLKTILKEKRLEEA